MRHLLLSTVLACAAAVAVPSCPAQAQQQVDPASKPPPVATLPPPQLVPGRASTTTATREVAGAIADHLRDCASRPVSQKLACFELVTSTLSPTLGESTTVGAWITEAGEGQDISVELGSTHFTTTDETYTGHGASLFVRCRAGQAQVYVAFGAKIAEKGAPVAGVNIYFDGNTNAQGTPDWVPSVAGTAVGLWNSERSNGMAVILMHSHYMSMDLALPDHKFLRAEFDLAGAATALSPIDETCGHW
jgi:hypothetical protein